MDLKKGFFLKLKSSFLMFTFFFCMQSGALQAGLNLEQLKNKELIRWILQVEQLCKPDCIHICDGSDEEFKDLTAQMVKTNTLIPLNGELRPNSFLSRSCEEDVARVEDRTFICSMNQRDAGPTNNWKEPAKMRKQLLELFEGSMRGRTMYVIPFSMGPLGSSISHIGIQITDSPYVVASMRIMTRMGKEVLNVLENNSFIPCLHSVGVPLDKGMVDKPWPCNPENKYIVHFPETKEIWSFGSGYGGNALLAKKCFALRIASKMGQEEGWLAEHMLIMGIENPQGEKKYFAAAFPSACGKTNLAMLKSALPGWKITLVGDDIAWMKIKEDGRLWAINPEAGMFGVAVGTSYASNPNAMDTIKKDTIFTNVGLTKEGDVWWEGMSKDTPLNCINWLGNNSSDCLKENIAHANARFATPISGCPCVDPSFDDPRGVPISAILFGGRRSSVIPLVMQSTSWQHGVFLGTTVSSETTAAANGAVGKLRHDPFAMLPFCGYHMGDYFAHWLSFSNKTDESLLPKIFYVNWFMKDENSQFRWPGFRENGRVMKWIFERIDLKPNAIKTPIGYLPDEQGLDLTHLSICPKNLANLLSVDVMGWQDEVKELREYYKIFEDKMPQKILEELDALEERLKKN